MIIGIDASRAFGRERTGTEEYSYQLIKHLQRLLGKRGHRLVLFVRPMAVIPEELRQNDVEILPINYRYLWTQVGLARATWQRQLDVLWVPAHTLPFARRPGLPTVVTIHGLEYKWLPEYNNWLQRWYLPLSTYYAARHASRVIAVSEATKRDLVMETRIDPDKISVIYEGVNPLTRWARDVTQKYGLERKKYVLFVGSLQPRKNLPVLIEAFAKASLPRGYRLVLAGARGWGSREIFAAPGRWGIPERVVFAGRVSEKDKWGLLHQAGIYVQPSITEGFGLPVLEAMAAQVPVIVSSGGALPEVVGGAGLVVATGMGMAERLTLSLERVAVDKRLQGKLARAGRIRSKELDWGRAAHSTMRLFEEMIRQ